MQSEMPAGSRTRKMYRKKSFGRLDDIDPVPGLSSGSQTYPDLRTKNANFQLQFHFALAIDCRPPASPSFLLCIQLASHVRIFESIIAKFQRVRTARHCWFEEANPEHSWRARLEHRVHRLRCLTRVYHYGTVSAEGGMKS